MHGRMQDSQDSGGRRIYDSEFKTQTYTTLIGKCHNVNRKTLIEAAEYKTLLHAEYKTQNTRLRITQHSSSNIVMSIKGLWIYVKYKTQNISEI